MTTHLCSRRSNTQSPERSRGASGVSFQATVSSDNVSINHTDEPSIVRKGAASSAQCVLAARRVDLILHLFIDL